MANKNTNRQVVEVANFSVGFVQSLLGDKGKFATVNFIKKKDGSERTLNGKTKVLGAMVGGEAAYDAASRGQVRVADVNIYKGGKREIGYRTVTVDNINWITANGKKYVRSVKTEPKLSFIQSVTHDSRNNVLRVMLNGVIYLYFGVTNHTYRQLIDAEDKGKFFRENIREKYRYERIN